MTIDSLNDRTQDRQENGVLMRIGPRIEQIAGTAADRPVVMLSGTVDPGKRLFVKKADESVFFCLAFQNLHDKHIVIASKIEFLEKGSELELSGRNLVVTRFCGDPQTPELIFNI